MDNITEKLKRRIDRLGGPDQRHRGDDRDPFSPGKLVYKSGDDDQHCGGQMDPGVVLGLQHLPDAGESIAETRHPAAQTEFVFRFH